MSDDIVERPLDPRDIVSRLRNPSAVEETVNHMEMSEAADEIERLRAALRECAADYISPPCTIPQAAVYVGEEFDRRMHIAAKALENT